MLVRRSHQLLLTCLAPDVQVKRPPLLADVPVIPELRPGRSARGHREQALIVASRHKHTVESLFHTHHGSLRHPSGLSELFYLEHKYSQVVGAGAVSGAGAGTAGPTCQISGKATYFDRKSISCII